MEMDTQGPDHHQAALERSEVHRYGNPKAATAAPWRRTCDAPDVRGWFLEPTIFETCTTACGCAGGSIRRCLVIPS